ncbi:MAG: hypothetical protein H6741_19170 [Alphaproteobacteria bacterium]|nr:hypothetical protein [Alphaproteobacteria bacterium]
MPLSFALLLLGALILALLWTWMRTAPRPQGIPGDALIGTVGVLSVAVPPGGVGAFAYVCEGGRVTRPCRSADRAGLPAGAEVWVSDLHGPLLVVERLHLTNRS